MALGQFPAPALQRGRSHSFVCGHLPTVRNSSALCLAASSSCNMQMSVRAATVKASGPSRPLKPDF